LKTAEYFGDAGCMLQAVEVKIGASFLVVERGKVGFFNTGFSPFRFPFSLFLKVLIP